MREIASLIFLALWQPDSFRQQHHVLWGDVSLHSIFQIAHLVDIHLSHLLLTIYQ